METRVKRLLQTQSEQIKMANFTELDLELTNLGESFKTLLSGVPLEENFGTNVTKYDILKQIGHIRNLVGEITDETKALQRAVKQAKEWVNDNQPPVPFTLSRNCPKRPD